MLFICQVLVIHVSGGNNIDINVSGPNILVIHVPGPKTLVIHVSGGNTIDIHVSGSNTFVIHVPGPKTLVFFNVSRGIFRDIRELQRLIETCKMRYFPQQHVLLCTSTVHDQSANICIQGYLRIL